MAFPRPYSTIAKVLICVLFSPMVTLAVEQAEKEQTVAPKVKIHAPESPEAANAAIRAKLRQTTEVDFPGIPLRDALAFIGGLHKIEIWIDETALADEGVAPDDPVELHLSKVTLRSALRLLLEPKGLSYVIEDEVMKVTTREVAEQTFDIRTHDLAKLMDAGIQPDNAVQIVQQMVRPETWNTSGGKAVVLPLPAALLVKQTQRGHEEIEDLLDLLEQQAANTRHAAK